MKKRKYLYRLIAVVMLMLVIPVILFFDFFWKNSFEEMEKTNEVYYDELLDSYIALYDEIIRDLNRFAASISSSSKDFTSVFFDGVRGLEENYLQLYNAAKYLKENYNQYNVSEWGIYLYDMDKIIKPASTLSSEYFILGMEDLYGKNDNLKDFFSAENYKLSSKLFCTTYSENQSDGCLLVGICTRIGKNNDKALVYFVISHGDIENSLSVINEQGLEFYLIDEESEHIMLAWGENAGENVESLIASESVRKIAGMNQKVIYQGKSNYTPFSIVMYISDDSLHSNIINYIYSMRQFLLVTIVIMVFICLGAIYIAYRPVYELTNELDYSEGSEFELVRSILNDRRSKIVEQEMLIMDLLLNHLVYGVHVSEKRIKRLGVDASMKFYCVFLLDGYVLTNRETEKLTFEIEKKQARLFVTDWQGENRSIFILFLKHLDISEIKAHFEQWKKGDYLDNCCLYTGKVVDKLDDIQLSLRSCFEQVRKKEIEDQKQAENTKLSASKEEIQKQMKEDILTYLDLHFHDANLSQVQVADLFQISNYTLSRLFKNQVGVGFAEYLVAKRMEYAKELLLTTSHSVNEISAMAGFASINHFSRTFRAFAGMSPSAFRKQS